jgi:hypothetical protein
LIDGNEPAPSLTWSRVSGIHRREAVSLQQK